MTENETKGSEIAREVSWMRVMMLVSLSFIATPVHFWLFKNAGSATAEFARFAVTALVFFAVIDSIVHLLTYNKIVQHGVKALRSWLHGGNKEVVDDA